MLIDAEQLINYQRCRRRAYLDVYGDLDQRDSTNEYVLKLVQDSQANQRTLLSNQPAVQPAHPAKDWQAAAAATLDLMRQGVERIHQGVLITETENGMTLKSNPDLLVKHPGISDFGDWLYVPTEIKLGKRPKLEYQVAVAFHAMVLAEVQGSWMETAWLMLRDRGAYSVDLWEVLPRMQEILAECTQMLVQQQEPEVFIARSRCSLCHWLSSCHAIAKNDYHLSLLPGVTPTRYVQLQALNLLTVKALAETKPSNLEPLPGFGKEAAHKLVRQAFSVMHDRALLIEESLYPNGNNDANHYLELPIHESHDFLAELLPTAPIELYFDIEAEPTLNLIYLHGVVVVDRHANTQTFHALLAERPEDEALVWQQLLELFRLYPTAPIFHFCPFEVQTVERLAKLYGTPHSHIKPLLARFVDVHERITRLVTLPVESYALKQIARWLGFEWRDPSANGAQSICWYAQWLSTGDRAHLNAILTYNEDDCLATHHIKEWLVGFLMKAIAEQSAELA
ncbi:TM0106 family RecB-like putative nuclease [Phormidium sp. CLA17]|uniref:TM0106 family RecB-like putative nuclease n=1 Tax=Leptolyngbya sp. Cla-17 TaxID=2803751 RepID=UPI00149123CF|nr:TM0106 family RecB-like putative nuclease [Leptolyngbya sp. Cla-17]MBM0740633.1 TM0106 family RecB-like putative nuclease [Leptolyngbya sp. Cla-17]